MPISPQKKTKTGEWERMNKWMLRFGILIVAISLLVGCTSGDNNEDPATNHNQTEVNDNSSVSSENEETISIVISVDHGEEVITEKEVTIEDGAILMDILKEHLDIDEDAGLIESIEGVAQDEDEGKYWLYTVNGEEAMVGANEYELTSGDEVVFDLHSWE